MADTQFDLGEALGGYEQAQADRNFYLSMVQGGTQMASPIAAYLAGVSGVKMANMRQQAQAVEDKRQAEKDAIAATERAQKRADNLDTQIINIMKGARDGSLAPAAAAGMLGYVMKERGYIPKGYDADNNVMTYGIPGDQQDYQFSLEKSATTKQDMQKTLEEGRDRRQAERIAAQKELVGIRGEESRKTAAYKQNITSGKDSALSTADMKNKHPKVTQFTKDERDFDLPSASELVSFGEDIKNAKKSAQLGYIQQFRHMANLLARNNGTKFEPEVEKLVKELGELERRLKADGYVQSKQNVESGTKAF